MGYRNPVIPGYYPDPSVCRAGEDFYLVTSSFEYFPGVPVFHSRDMVNWEQIGHALTRPSQLPLENCRPSGGIYAPTIRYHDGTFYMVTTNVSHGGNFYVHTKDPAGEWSEPVYVAQGGIDPSLFFDDDGKVYFTSNQPINRQFSITTSEIDIATGKLITKPRRVWGGTGGRHPEAPHLYKIRGIYYLMIAEGGTELGHMVTIARSASPYGPFEACPHNPILSQRDHPLNVIQGTGHADLVEAADGSWWLVFLGFRLTTRSFHHLGRETFLAPVSWDADGWPVVNQNRQIYTIMDVPTLPPHPFPEKPIRDDFDGEKLGLEWNFLRNPHPENYDLTARPSAVGLRAAEENLFSVGSPSFIGRRQQHWRCRAQTLLDFEPETDGEEAGLTVFYQPQYHYEIAVTKINDARKLIVRRTSTDMSYIAFETSIGKGPIVLGLAANKSRYTLLYGAPGGELQTACTASVIPISTEATVMSFTGTYFGLYATANSQKTGNTAYFEWFDYEGFEHEVEF